MSSSIEDFGRVIEEDGPDSLNRYKDVFKSFSLATDKVPPPDTEP
jgi:hypothetical protein